MKSILIFITIFCFHTALNAQSKDEVDSVKSNIESYLPSLNEQVNKMEKSENLDSIKIFANEIHTNLDSLFVQILRAYKYNKDDLNSGTYSAMGSALDGVSPGAGAIFHMKSVDKLLKSTPNEKFFNRMNNVNIIAKKISRATKIKKVNKLKKKLIARVKKLNQIQLK